MIVGRSLGYVGMVGWVALVVLAGCGGRWFLGWFVMAALVFVLFLTFQAVHIYRSADDESSKEEEEAAED